MKHKSDRNKRNDAPTKNSLGFTIPKPGSSFKSQLRDAGSRACKRREELAEVQKKMVALKRSFHIPTLTLAAQDPDALALDSSPDYVWEFYRLKQREDELKQELIKLGEEAPIAAADSTSTPATAIGRSIEAFRKECGWSFDKLAEKSGIDKKLILSHVHKGTKPTPRILKEYAQAFSKGLQRTISVSDLEK